MNYDDVRRMIGYIAKDNYEDLVKALVSFENGIYDEKVLDKIFVEFMDCDGVGLLNDYFDHLIDDIQSKNEDITVEKNERKVTFYVDQDSEFHTLGNRYTNITNVSEAISTLKKAAEENVCGGITEIGISVPDPDDESFYIEMGIAGRTRIDMDILQYIPAITENEKATEMIAELVCKMPEAEITGEVPKAIQDKIDKMQSKNELNTTNFLDRVKSNSENSIYSVSKDREIEI